MLYAIALPLAATLAPVPIAQQVPPAGPPIIVPDVDDDYHLVPWPSDDNDPEIWQEGDPFGRWVSEDFSPIIGGDAVGLRGDRLYVIEGFQFTDTLRPFDDLQQAHRRQTEKVRPKR